jgi:hypothetical protein
MRRTHALLPFVVVPLLFAGCGTGPQKTAPVGGLKAEMQGLPKWALGKCQDTLKSKDVLCASGSVEGMSSLTMARSASEGRARTELARMLQLRVKSMLKDYQAATQGGPENKTTGEQHIEDVSKQITNLTLSGSRVEDTFVSDTGSFWTLVVIDAPAFKDSLTKAHDLDEQVRSQIIERADKAFKEIDDQK